MHAADNEGLQQGIDEQLVAKLGQWCSVPVTYAGGGRSLADLELVKRIVKNNPRHLKNADFEDKSNTSLHLAARYGYAAIAVRFSTPTTTTTTTTIDQSQQEQQ